MPQSTKSKALILRPVASSFRAEVKSLTRDWGDISDAYGKLTEQMVSFGQNFQKLWNRAHDLDGQSEGSHVDYLRDEMATAVGTSNPSIWSRWVKIGSQAKALLTYKESLPAQRDSLYEIALAVEEHQPVRKWISSQELTPDSTVRDVKALRKPKKQKRRRRQKTYTATVTLCFQSYSDAATALKDLISSKSDFQLRSHQAFGEALKEALGVSGYEKAQERFI